MLHSLRCSIHGLIHLLKHFRIFHSILKLTFVLNGHKDKYIAFFFMSGASLKMGGAYSPL